MDVEKPVSTPKEAPFTLLRKTVPATVADMKRILPLVVACLVAGAASSGHADDQDQAFFRSVRGVWAGPGKIVAGKYKGTRFSCRLKGDTPSDTVGMALSGQCRMGMLSQKMSAVIQRRSHEYQGVFLDGSSGEGLDIVSGEVSDDQAAMYISHSKLKGILLTRLPRPAEMTVTLSIFVGEDPVPVIEMDLKRVRRDPGILARK